MKIDNFIARDKSGRLFLYDQKPYYDENGFYIDDDNHIHELDYDLFPFITYENSPVSLNEFSLNLQTMVNGEKPVVMFSPFTLKPLQIIVGDTRYIINDLTVKE